MKKLVTEQTVKEFAAGKEKIFPIDSNTLVTPLARDMAKSLGIKFMEANCAEASAENKAIDVCAANIDDEKKCDNTGQNSNMTNSEMRTLVETVMKALKERGILDKILD